MVNNTLDMYDYLVCNEIATDEEIKLVTQINGDNIDTYENILYARTGYRNFEQLEEEDE